MNLEQLLPQIQKLISEKITNLLSKEGPKAAIKGVYTLLPAPIRIFIKEETFVEFCLSHQEKIFGKAAVKPVKKTPARKKTVKKTTDKKVPPADFSVKKKK